MQSISVCWICCLGLADAPGRQVSGLGCLHSLYALVYACLTTSAVGVV
jgi:hypothetical protein